MRKTIIAAAVAVFATTTALAGNDTAKMQEQMLGVTAQLNGNCSATLIYSDRDNKTGDVQTVFLTAKHCVDKAKSDIDVDIPVYQDGRVVKKDRYIARVRGKDYKSDLALVELKDKQTFFEHTASIAGDNSVPAMGSPAWTVGYPLGLGLTVTQGMFGSLETLDAFKPGEEYFRATPDVVGGNSGGAMYVMDGDNYVLVGVTSAAHRTYTHVAFYTPIAAIRTYLERALPASIGEEKKSAPRRTGL